jgi:aryl-alcohol dehydrogenase-like predicted oxidoreductase
MYCVQPQYNLLWRDRFEVEYAPVFAQFGMGLVFRQPAILS